MKVLIISEDENVLYFIDSELKKMNIDSIKYKWFLKALDNIEEISPDIIVINALDYPCHWKVLAQFVRNNTHFSPKIILYIPENFSSAENDKAKELGIKSLFSNLNDFTKEFNNVISSNTSSKTDDSALAITNETDEKTILDDWTFYTVENLFALDTLPDYEIPTCENLFSSEVSNDFVLFTCENILEVKVSNEDDWTLRTTSNLFETEGEDYALNTVENIFIYENESDFVLFTSDNLLTSSDTTIKDNVISSLHTEHKKWGSLLKKIREEYER